MSRPLPPETPLSGYKAPVIQIECHRCRRNAPELEVYKLVRRFGTNITVGQLALQLAGSGSKPCGLVSSGQCSARAFEPEPWTWGTLEHAWKGHWLGRLHCQRHVAALKRTDPCPEVVILDVETLHAAFGYDFPLWRLPSKMGCPRCHGRIVSIEWTIPPTTPEPYAPAADVVPLRLKPTRAQQGRKRFRVIEGEG